MGNDIGKYFAFSFLVHLSVLAFLLVRVPKPAYIYLPVQLQFYSQSNGHAITDAKKKNEHESARKSPPEKKRESVKTKQKEENFQKTVKPAEKEIVQPEAKPQGVTGAAGTSPQPVMGSNISLDAVNFPYTYYTNMVVKKIGQNWSWGQKFGRLKSLVYFRIERSGGIRDLAVKKSSGEEIFDQQAMRSVELASPFPPLPEGYKEESLGVYFEFSYTE